MSETTQARPEVLKALLEAEKELSQDKGPFRLFALMLREDAADRWDLVAAASWLRRDDRKSFALIVDELKKRLEPDDFITISHIALLDETNPAVETMNRAVQVEHGDNIHLVNCSFFGMPIENAYVFTSLLAGAAADEADWQPT